MTPAQVVACLAGPADAGRQRVALADGLEWCHRRRDHKARWLRGMMEEKHDEQ